MSGALPRGPRLWRRVLAAGGVVLRTREFLWLGILSVPAALVLATLALWLTLRLGCDRSDRRSGRSPHVLTLATARSICGDRRFQEPGGAAPTMTTPRERPTTRQAISMKRAPVKVT